MVPHGSLEISMEPPDQLSGLAELSARIFFLSSMWSVLIELLQLV